MEEKTISLTECENARNEVTECVNNLNKSIAKHNNLLSIGLQVNDIDIEGKTIVGLRSYYSINF